jgi:MFS family permease
LSGFITHFLAFFAPPASDGTRAMTLYRQRSAVRQSAILPSASSDRRGVVGLLVLLFAITYLDRVCISVAGPRMQEDLGIDPIGWGWVTGMFTLAYCLFEIPTGMMGDRMARVASSPASWCGGRRSPP